MSKHLGWAAVLALLLALLAGAALGDTAQEITQECTFRTCSSSRRPALMTDGKYTSYWESKKMQHPWVTITSETPMHGLYLCFRQLSSSFEIQVRKEEEWVSFLPGDTRFQHTYYDLGGVRAVRIYSTQESSHKIGFNEIFVFGPGEVPDWVQRWEETETKADLLFISAHPDDELIFFGGAIPTYAAEMGKRVVVAYLTWSNTTRRSEALNGLWAMGLRHYPVFGGFQDKYSRTLKDAYTNAGKEKVLAWMTELFRRVRPEVVVTQDLEGEYGHGQHKMVADAAAQAWNLAADPAQYPDSAAEYGPWQVKKLYLHLYGEEEARTRFDWNVPLSAFGGKTGLQVAAEAYALHVTQASAKVKVNGKWHLLSVEETGSIWPNTAFGLYATTVGPDITHTDFLENIEE